MMERRTYRART